ncbi:hypothetical protein PI125_g14618 [Phytophthora idaei]|nr:hypothetical protein PI125_g14618 [Phytophthora idaei]
MSNPAYILTTDGIWERLRCQTKAQREVSSMETGKELEDRNEAESGIPCQLSIICAT